jgi:hypothetical protein
VWDRRPNHDELLNARLSAGWRPTASKLKGGDKVLGYAACAVSALPHRHSGGDA